MGTRLSVVDGQLPVDHDGIICHGKTYKDKVKLTFARGASLKRVRPGDRLPKRSA